MLNRASRTVANPSPPGAPTHVRRVPPNQGPRASSPFANAGPVFRLAPVSPIPAADLPVQRAWHGDPVPKDNVDLKHIREKYAEEEEANEDATLFWSDLPPRVLVYYPAQDDDDAAGYLHECVKNRWADKTLQDDELTDMHEAASGALDGTPLDTRLGGELQKLLAKQDHVTKLLAREKEPEELRWLVGLDDDTTVQALVSRVFGRGERISALRTVMEYNDQTQAYADQTVAGWLLAHGPARTQEVLKLTAAEYRISWVKHCFSDLVYADTPKPYSHLIRIVAYVQDSENNMAVSKPDVVYVNATYPPARTGFLQFNFAVGNPAEIHTHWNTRARQLLSMHVQAAGVNGYEFLNGGFGAVARLVRDTHNARIGNPDGPTTAPRDQTLTL